MGWVVKRKPRPLYPQVRDPVPITYYVGSWMGPWAGLDRCGKSRPHRHLIPGPSNT